MLTTGESVPLISGFTRTANNAIPSVAYQQTGTTVRLTPKVEADDRILLKLYVDSSRLHRGAPDLPVETAILQQSTSQMRLETEVILHSGQTKTISNSPTNGDPKRPAEQALILITAKLVAD